MKKQVAIAAAERGSPNDEASRHRGLCWYLDGHQAERAGLGIVEDTRELVGFGAHGPSTLS
jgi:hypothetical protein